MPRRIRNIDSQYPFTYNDDAISDQDHVQAFKQRQQVDYRRFTAGHSVFVRRTPFGERYENQIMDRSEMNRATPPDSSRTAGEEAWMNSEGERLQDFGVDEDTDFTTERTTSLYLNYCFLRGMQQDLTIDLPVIISFCSLSRGLTLEGGLPSSKRRFPDLTMILRAERH